MMTKSIGAALRSLSLRSFSLRLRIVFLFSAGFFFFMGAFLFAASAALAVAGAHVDAAVDEQRRGLAGADLLELQLEVLDGLLVELQLLLHRSRSWFGTC